MDYIIAVLSVAAAIVLLSVRVILKRGGRFSSSHISENKLMRERGIGCAVSQDRQQRSGGKSRIDVKKL